MNQSKKPSNQFAQKIEELTQQVAELTAALQRERADAVNIRRQHQEQLANVQKMIKADTVEQLLPVIDHFELALKHVPANLKDDNFVKGVQGIVKQFEKTLEDMGVQRIPTIGHPFDPSLHEAVSAEDEAETIGEELQAGYKIGDTVIRHAKVKVSRS